MHSLNYFFLTILILSLTSCGSDKHHTNLPNTPVTSDTNKTIVDVVKPKNDDKNTSVPEHNPIVVPPLTNRGIVINEVLTANATINLDPDFKQFSDWIELYNSENHAIDISGFYLSDDIANPTKYKIPRGTTLASHAYILIWADAQNTKANAIHANFKLSQKGEHLILADKNADVIDTITFKEQDGDISCTKVNDTIVYMTPTPKSANTQIYGVLKRAKKPMFSHASGFYDGSQSIELTQKNGATIYYTLDGSTPTKSSTLYTNPISIDETTIIRTRAYEKSKLLSNVKNQTFLINEDISIPVISIAMDDAYLNDENIGIYKNYKKSWMRAGSIELIEDGKSQFSENIGVRIFGHNTRVYSQKSLSIFVKNKYGPKSLKYPLFKDKPKIQKVKSFLLRNSGNDWGHTMIKDALSQGIVKDNMDIDYQSYSPTVVFLNGQYWGIHNIREKINEDYLEANHGINPDKVDVLKSKYFALTGDNQDYVSLVNYIENHDLSNTEYYQHVASKIDIIEYINYMIAEIYGGNSDWPYSNIKYWKEKTPDGKWRWVLFDLDYTYDSVSSNTLELALASDGLHEPNPPWATLLFRSLMKNSDFKDVFIGRFTTHLNTTFKPTRIHNIITSLKNTIKPEIVRHLNRWENSKGDSRDWESGAWWSISKLHSFADQRHQIIRTQMHDILGVSGSENLSIPKSTQGQVFIDDVELTTNFNGEYFNATKVTLKAIPDVGHSFVKWSNGDINPEIIVTINSDITISAEFN